MTMSQAQIVDMLQSLKRIAVALEQLAHAHDELTRNSQ